MSLTIYHNPRCSKSRKTLEIIEAAGIRPAIVAYLDQPLAAERITVIAGWLERPVRDLLRPGEAVVREAPDLPDLDDDAALAEWISRHPQALQRPIVVDDETGRAVIGRPPEDVLTLLPE